MSFKEKKKLHSLNYIVDASQKCIKYVKSHDEKTFSSHNYDDSIIRADFCDCLISIIFNTNSIEKTILTIKKFSEKTTHHKEIQFCIKTDNDDEDFIVKFLNKLSKYNFNFVILASPKGRGFVDLWQWVNYLYKVSSKNSKFVMNISDEMFVKEEGWDENLKRYLNLEKDSIYRLRTSVYKNRNYNDLWECGYAPDTTAIYTKRYIEIQKNFSPCFGPDNCQQIVAYYLSKINYPRHTQFLRDRVINDISYEGQGTNIGLKGDELYKRRNLNHRLWLNLFSYKNQTNLFQRARKLQIEILKTEFKDLSIKELNEKYVVKFYTKENSGQEVKRVIYLTKKISYLKLFFYNLVRFDFFKYNTGYTKNKISSILVTLNFLFFKKFPKQKIETTDIYLEKLIEIERNITSNIFIKKKYDKFKLNIRTSLIIKNFYEGESKTSKRSIISTVSIIFYVCENIINFILFYIKIFVLLIFWVGALLLFSIMFWKALRIFNYVFIRFCSFNLSNKSYIFRDNNDQSKSIIIKGD